VGLKNGQRPLAALQRLLALLRPAAVHVHLLSEVLEKWVKDGEILVGGFNMF
jgi:hypothetical protein